MNTEKTTKLVQKCTSVIDSCRTIEQAAIADRYVRLVIERIAEHEPDEDYFHELQVTLHRIMLLKIRSLPKNE